MNQTCQTAVAPVIDYDGRVYVAADQTVIVVTMPSPSAKHPSAADFFSMVPSEAMKAIGAFSSVTGLAVTSWSSVLYINTGTGLHTFLFDGTPLWSTIVQFKDSAMTSPKPMGPCVHNITECSLFPQLAVDECDGSIYVARTDGLIFSYAAWQPFLRWSYAFSDNNPLSVKIVSGSNGRVYAAIAKYDVVYALSADTGTILWQVEVGPLSDNSCMPRVDSLGFVSVGSLDGFVYVISPDGAFLRKYLATNSFSPVSIMVAPVLDCSDKALFVLQTRVLSKTIINQADGTKDLANTQYLGMNIYMLVPSSGLVLWSTSYPDHFPAALLEKELSSYNCGPDWLIAITVIANLSRNSLCKSAETRYKASCSEVWINMTTSKLPGSSRPLIVFAISVLVVFLLLSLFAILVYFCWSAKQTAHRQKLCRLLRQKRFRQPQGLLLRRRKAYERNIEYLRAELQSRPKSIKIVDQLRGALEGLHFVEQYLAMFPSDTSQSDHLQEERRLVEDTIAASVGENSHKQRGFWIDFMDSVSRILLGPPGKEDFTKEMQIFAEYDECLRPTAAPVPLLSKPKSPVKPSPSQQSVQFRRVNPHPVSREDPSAGFDAVSAEDYTNPLYDTSPTPSTKKTVSFSTVNEIFEGDERLPITMSDDDEIVSEENPNNGDDLERNGQEDSCDGSEENAAFDDVQVSQEQALEYQQ